MQIKHERNDRPLFLEKSSGNKRSAFLSHPLIVYYSNFEAVVKSSSKRPPISYPAECSGFLVSRWGPGETLENSKKKNFFDWLSCNSLHCFTADLPR